MFNLLDGQLFSNVVSRVEQSRFSYTSQNEEFHNLNTNLQTYLSDIKRIDDENGELQKTIEQIRTNYILTLENHLQRLPEDFREESRILTDAHLERYKSKTRAKRFINQREEFKKRITFVANNEKEQVKYINYLQKQERSVQKELKVLSDQFQNLYKSIEREKQIHQQAMDKVDQLQIQLEQICIERSKTEFEIQNLREEVKLMQTAKEFLNDEYETILSTQTEANEYFISCLDESIINIREDFDDLNKRQLKQVENEYKQMIKILEENSLTTANINETTMNHQRKTQFECEKLQDEHQSIAQELTTLNDHNQILSERIFAMESDLFTIRDEHIQDLIIKDDELEQSKNELQSLHNKLSHLTEYDRNLKFELTLYRGVLESEYRRKQQQQQSNNNQQLARPTILRTTITRNNKNVPVLTSHNQFETINEQGNSIFEVTISKKNHIIDEKNKNRQELEQEDNLTRPWKKSFIEDEFENVQSTNTNSQGEHQISIVSPKQQSSPELQLSTKNFETLVANDSPSPDRSNSLNDDQTSPENSNLPTALPDEDQQTRMDNQKLSTTPPSIVPENSSEVQETSTSPADSEKQQIFLKDSQSSLIQPEDEHEFSEVDQSLITSQNDKETSSTNSPMNEETSLTTANNIVQPSNQSILSEDHRSLSNSQEEIRHSSSISSIDEQKPKISPMNTTEAAADLSVSLDDYRSHLLQQEDKDEPIEISQTSSLQSEEQSTSSKADQSHVTFEEQDQQLLTRSPTEKQIPLEMQQSSASPTNSAPSDLHQVSSDQQDQLQIYSKHQRSPSQSQEEIQQLSTRSPIEEEIPSEIQKSRSSSTNSTSSKDLPATSEAHNLSSEQLEEQQKSPEHDRSLSISQEEVHQLSTSLPLEEQVSSEKQKSRTSSTNSISSKDLPVTLEAHNLSSDQFDERQESPRHDRSLSTSQEEVHQLSTSLPIEEEIPSDIQKSRSSSTDSGSLKDLLVQSAVRQPSSDQQEKQGQSQTHRSSLSSSQEEPEQLLIKSPTEEQASFEFQKSPTSRTSTTSSEILQSSLNQPERQQQSPEHRRSVTSWPEDAEQLFTKTPIEEQIPFKTQKSPTSPTSTSSSQAHHLSSEQLEEQQESPKDHRSPYTSQEEIQQLSTISPKEEKEPFEVQKSPTSRNSSASSDIHQSHSDQLDKQQELPEHDRSLSTSQEAVHQLSRSLPIEEKIPLEMQKSRSSSIESASLKDLSVQSEVHQPPSDQQDKSQESPEHNRSFSSSQDVQQLSTISPKEEQEPFELQTSRKSTASSDIHQSPSDQLDERQQSPEHNRSLSTSQEDVQQLSTSLPIEVEISSEMQKSRSSSIESASSKNLSLPTEVHHLSSEQLKEQQDSEEHDQPLSSSQEAQQLSTTSPTEEKMPFEIQKPPISRTSTAPSQAQYLTSEQLEEQQEFPKHRRSISASQDDAEQLFKTSPLEEKIPFEIQKSPVSRTSTGSSEIHQSPSKHQDKPPESPKRHQSVTSWQEEAEQLFKTSPLEEKIPFEIPTSPVSRTSTASSGVHRLSAEQLEEQQDSPKHDRSLSSSQEAQQLLRRSLEEEQMSFQIPKSPTSRTSTVSSEIHQPTSDQLEGQLESPNDHRSLSASQDVQQTSTTSPIEEQTPFEDQKSQTSRTSTVSSEARSLGSEQIEKRQESPKHHRSLSSSQDEAEQLFTKSPIEEQMPLENSKSPISRTSTSSSEVHHLPAEQVEEQQDSRKDDRSLSSSQEVQQFPATSSKEEQEPFEDQISATSRASSALSGIYQTPLDQLEEQPAFPKHRRSLSSSKEDGEQLLTRSSINEQMPFETQKSPTSRTSTSSSEAYHLSSDQLEERPDSPKHDWSLSASQEAQQLSAKSPREEQILFPTPKSPTSRTSSASSEVHQAPSEQLEEREDSPKHDRSLSLSYEEVQQLSTSLPIEEEIPLQISKSPTSRTSTVSSDIHQAPSDQLEKKQEFPKHSRSPSSSEEETEQLFTRSVVGQQSLFEIPKLPGSRTSSASSEVYQLPLDQREDRLESPKHDRPMSSLQERQQKFTESPIEEQIPFEKEESATSPTNSVSSKDLSASSETHHLFSHQLEEPQESPENYRSLSTSQEEVHQLARKLSTDEENSSTSPGTTTAAINRSMTPEDDPLSSMQSTDQYEPTASSQLLSSGAGKRPESLGLRESITSPKEESKQIIAASPESDNSTTSPTNTTSPTDQLSSFKTTQSSSYNHPIISNVSQSNPIESPNVLSQEDPSISSNIQRKSWTPLEEYLTSSELEKFPVNDENVQEHFSSTPSDEYRIESPIGKVDNDKQLAESSDEYDNDTEYDDKPKPSSSSYAINQVSNDKLDSINRQSRLPSIEEHETNQYDKEERSSFDLSKTSFSEVKQNINSPKTNELILEEDLPSPEEQISSSDYNPIEEDSGIGYISSSGYYGTLNDSNPLTNQDLNKEVPYQTSLTDVDADNIDLSEKIDNSTSSKTEEDDCDVTNESNLETVMQDLRYVYRDLANDEDLVEINTEFPDSLIDRLEFGDNFIRTLFDDFLRKYLVQPAQYEIRSKTLDWNEFRDILFPILTGRYMEKHIRKLFDLFDTTKDGYLTLQEIIALFELLQVANTAELAQYMITEFDKNQDGKLNINEFLEIVKKTSDVTNNILSEKIEYRPWYNRHPIDDGDNNDDDDDLQSISLEVPVINFERKPNADIINNEIFLLGRIFKKVGGDVENKQLDSTKPTLSMKITNEFIHNNVHISNDDLNLFIDLYLTKKQNSDHLINWTEFRDIFLPLVNGGMIDKHEISHWFDILDINHNRTITNEQTLLLLRLLQMSNPDDILNKMNEISQTYINNNGTWTLEELIFALENIDETTSHLCSINEKIKSFDRAWLTKNIF